MAERRRRKNSNHRAIFREPYEEFILEDASLDGIVSHLRVRGVEPEAAERAAYAAIRRHPLTLSGSLRRQHKGPRGFDF